jgi:demethoxyubiquinone hydroxylase (CLK1/Coq7/Cat5 family)
LRIVFFGFSNLDVRHYEQKIRNLEYENQELRTETLQLKIDTENYEHQEQSIVDNFVNDLGKNILIFLKNISYIFLLKLMQMLK